MSREGALWIGGLEPYMDEDFIQKALNQMGEQNLLSIKVIKNKFTGEAAGYGFINFINDHVALTVMHKLNGKLIPNSTPPVRFKLNHNSTRLLPGERDHSIWVGDLTPDVDDLQLFRFFSARFQSIKSAKGEQRHSHIFLIYILNNILHIDQFQWCSTFHQLNTVL
jgi:RNA recognition motif-containing protein